MRVVVLHRSLVLEFRIDEVQLYHQLATVADAKAQSVLTGEEALQGSLCVLVPDKAASPSFRRTKHVGVGETSAEHNHIDVVKSFATRHKVGHVNVFHIKAGEIKRICHLAVAVHALLADNGSLDACRSAAVAGKSVRGKRAFEILRQFIAYRLLLIVLKTLFRTCRATLTAVEQIR